MDAKRYEGSESKILFCLKKGLVLEREKEKKKKGKWNQDILLLLRYPFSSFSPIKQTAWNERGGGGEEKATALYGIDPFSHNDPNFCGEKGGRRIGKEYSRSFMVHGSSQLTVSKTEGGMKEPEEPHLFLNKSGETLTVSAGIFTAKTSSRNLHINGGCKNIAENCNV